MACPPCPPSDASETVAVAENQLHAYSLIVYLAELLWRLSRLRSYAVHEFPVAACDPLAAVHFVDEKITMAVASLASTQAMGPAPLPVPPHSLEMV